MARQKGLTEKEKKFCEIYVTNYNATQAYMKAYGVEHKVALALGWRVLKRDVVKDYIAELQKEMKERWGDIASLLVEELMKDITERDDKGKHNTNWQKSVDLLQKQLGLNTTNQKIDATVSSPNITITIGEDEENVE